MGGYRTVFNPRHLLHNLESNVQVKEAWHELWGELHHQGDVGDASYAAVPQLVRIHGERKLDDWNTYALVAVIELSSRKGQESRSSGVAKGRVLLGNSGARKTRGNRNFADNRARRY